MDKNCTIYKTADFIGKKWTLFIILELYKENLRSKRFLELKNNLPKITPKILSLRLKELEAIGLITKKIYTKSFPIRCEYSLTESGKEFMNVVKYIKKWALKWKLNNSVCESTDCKNCKIPKEHTFSNHAL